MVRTLTVPEGWQEIQLNDLCEFRKGAGLSKGKLSTDGKNECILYGELYTKYSEVINDVESRTDTTEGVRSISGDVLIPASTTTCAMDLAIAAALNKGNVLLGGDINILRSRKNNYDSVFLAHHLSHFEKISLARFAQGSTIIHLYGRDFKELYVCIPIDKQEQQKIAEVFIACDKAIDKTVAKIEKLKKIRQGLMQDLFRYGIDEHGQMRSETTYRFKDSPLGRIPEEWEVKTLEQLDIEIIDGDRSENYPKQEDFLTDGYCVFLSADNVTVNGFRFDAVQFISKEKDQKLRKGKLKFGDVVLTTRGTVGNMAYYDQGINFQNIRINSGMILFRILDSAIDRIFFLKSFSDLLLPKQYSLVKSGSAQPQLPIRDLSKFYFLKPSRPEQTRMVSVLSFADEAIEKEETYKQKLFALKDGLMEDLLSGTVRVNHLIRQTA